MKIKSKDILNFGIDYIEVIGTSSKLENINFKTTKSDEYIIDEGFPNFKIKKSLKVTNYEYKIVLKKNGYDCLAYHKGMTQGGVDTNDFISVYGVAFKIFKNVAEIVDFIKDIIDIKGIRRFDLAIDLTIELSKIYKDFKPLKQKGSKFYDDKGGLQTFYIGEKKKSLNRYKLLRCYNKKDDILRTYRQDLYVDYLKQDNVTRIEFEFRSELCKKITLNQLLDRTYIFNIFLSYIKQYTRAFDKFKFDITKLNVQNKRVDIEELKSNQLLKQRYLNIFIGYSKTIKEIGGCPVDILLRKDILKNTTKKDIVLSIKDGIFRQDIYEFGLNVRNSKYIFSKEVDDVIYLPNEGENE